MISEEQNGDLSFEYVKSTLAEDTENTKLYIGQELDDATETMKDYPTLIYDGPFSDNIDTKKSALIENLPEISKEEALKKAATFLNINETELYFLSESKGNLDCYNFYNTDLTISVTKKGGIVTYMLYSRFADESTLTHEEAIEKARLESVMVQTEKKILTDIRDYLVAILDEWHRRSDDPHFLENNIMVYNHLRKELDDLTEYAEKLGVEL